jgi:hypothetical protein
MFTGNAIKLSPQIRRVTNTPQVIVNYRKNYQGSKTPPVWLNLMALTPKKQKND